MILEKLMAFICDEIGMDISDISEDSLIYDLVNDEFEMQELLEAIGEEFEVEIDNVQPEEGWSIEDLANAVSDAE